MSTVVIKDKRSYHSKAQDWCLENLGLDSQLFLHGVWNCKTIAIDTSDIVIQYKFLNEKDAVMFALRWK